MQMSAIKFIKTVTFVSLLFLFHWIIGTEETIKKKNETIIMFHSTRESNPLDLLRSGRASLKRRLDAIKETIAVHGADFTDTMDLSHAAAPSNPTKMKGVDPLDLDAVHNYGDHDREDTEDGSTCSDGPMTPSKRFRAGGGHDKVAFFSPTKRILGVSITHQEELGKQIAEERVVGKEFESLQELSTQMRMAVRDQTFSDVVLRVGRNPTHMVFAHRFILVNRSEYFRSVLQREQREMDIHRRVVIDFPDVPFIDVFHKVLDYLYCGQIRLRLDDVIEVMAMAEMLKVQSLKDICTQFCKENIDHENACQLLEMARLFEVHYLEQLCLDYIDRNAPRILASQSFEQLSEKTLIHIIRRNELQLEPDQEVQLFQAVYRWAKYHSDQKLAEVADSEGDDDDDEQQHDDEVFANGAKSMSKMSNSALDRDPVASLKTLLQTVITHVRFPLMTSEQLVSVVEPCSVVPQPLLFEAYSHHVRKHLGPQKSDIGNTTRFQRRAMSQVRPAPFANSEKEAQPSSTSLGNDFPIHHA